MNEELDNHQHDAEDTVMGIRRPTYISFAASSSLRVPEEKLLVASLSVAERRQQIQMKAGFAMEAAKQEHTDVVMSDVEPVLLKLCRQQKWDEVLERCSTHPEEAVPIEMPQVKRERHSPRRFALRSHGEDSLLGSSKTPTVVYNDTPLGLVCNSNIPNEDVLSTLVKALLTACPSQIQSSQQSSGHTPLRDAVQNPACTPDVLSLLIEADITLPGKPCLKAINMKDRDGLEPIDHLIMGVHVTSSEKALELLNLFLYATRAVNAQGHGKECSCGLTVSPLIRLLSMGTSYGLNVQSGQGKNRASEEARLLRVQEAARHIVGESKSILQVRARSTQCTALHVALRNYGDCLSLIQFLLEMDENNFMIKQRNLYGDLPLHVACSVGVPTDIFTLIVNNTVTATKGRPDAPHPLVWSTNISGYTAVDLEWMRHIEGGRGFFESRAFYPLEACGIRWHCSRQDEFYRELLQEAVNKVLQTNPQCHDNKKAAKDIFGVILDRILFLIKVAHEGKIPTDLTALRNGLVHAASSLCRLPGPSLPKAMLDLIHWMDPDQVFQADQLGRCPLHYSAMPGSTYDEVTLSTRRKDQVIINDYRGWTDHLLETNPEAAQTIDNHGRLPLHYVLKGSSVISGEFWGSLSEAEQDNEMAAARNQLVWKLVDAYPHSVEYRDPLSRMYPFMLAAANPNMTLDMVYRLLHRSPTLVRSGCHA
jgi:hypothetical protein